MVSTSGFDAAAYIAPPRTFDGPIVLDVDVQMVTGHARILFHANGEHFGREYHAQIWSKDSEAVDYRSRLNHFGYKNGCETGFSPHNRFPGNVDANSPSPFSIPNNCHFTVRRVNRKIDFYVNWVRIGTVKLLDDEVLPATGTVGLS